MFEVKSITVAKGFTKEQQKYIADEILKEINNNKNISAIVEIIKNQHKNDIKESLKYYIKNGLWGLYCTGRNEEKETIKIKLPDCNFKIEIINDLNNLHEFLTKKIHVNIQLKNQKEENKIINEIKKIGEFIETKEAIIDAKGGLLINKNFIGEFSENETTKKDNICKIDDLIEKNIVKLPANYRIEENQKTWAKGEKFTIIYKNKKSNFTVIQQNYLNIIKKITKDFDIYINDTPQKKNINGGIVEVLTNQVIFKTKKGEFIGLIMPIISNFKLSDFELLSDIVEVSEVSEVSEVEEITEEEEKEINKINSEFIKAEIKEAEKEEKEEKEKNYTHINYITGHEYTRNNIKILDDFMKENNYTESVWMGAYQAKKANLQLKKNAKPVIIQVFHENLDGTIFKMSEAVYNIADFEQIQKVENTEEFKNIVDELKKAV